ncbi:MAG: nuclear transport factor 2 family protein [Bacteroidia bacterium]|nr:nuclear transport factor 2 family protein [Bacteroidia bacterium]
MKNFLLFILSIILGQLAFSQETTTIDEQYDLITPVQTQLDAYNTGNIDLFLSAYSDSVKIYNYPDQLKYQGKENMREPYGKMFKELKFLHCRLVNRMVMGNKVLDHEFVTFQKDSKPVQVIAIYTVQNGKITEVRFMRK